MGTLAAQPDFDRTAATEGSAQATAAPLSRQSEAWRALAHAPDLGKPPRHADAAYEWFASKAVGAWPLSRRYRRLARRVLALESELAGLSAAAFQFHLRSWQTQARLRRLRTAADRVRALAAVREAGRRTLGLSAYPAQVAAALALLDGRMTEMATGEGKTLVAALAAVCVGWGGRGCHVITVNDYLAQRDAQWALPLFSLCGLTAAPLTGDTPPPERAAAYAADITYTTQKEAAADHLRDRLARRMARDRPGSMLASVLARQLGSPQPLVPAHPGVVMRGLEAAIVDEADSVLLDEAVTPLIISGQGNDPGRTQAFALAARHAARLRPDQHFQLDLRHRDLRLTRAGRSEIDRLGRDLPGPFRGERFRHEMFHQALTARHLYRRGDHYVVQEGKVVIIDQATGRLMPDRNWRAGLHQAIEAKENLEINHLQQTLASISFQRFFRHYRHLAGTTGTAWNDRAEIWRTYRLRTIRIATHRPCRRQHHRTKPVASQEAKWAAVVAATAQHHAAGRPALLGTRSVEDSETLSRGLAAAGLPHEVLNARSHEREADIVAQAGQAGRITVATNMAGRGTDIKLGPGVAELGGLVVIATDRHESPRVDRQLRGRAARQGEPGIALEVTSLDDHLLRRFAPRLRRLATACRPLLPTPALRVLIAFAQHRAARQTAHQRRQVQLQDEHLAEQVGF
ncbi:MAG: hypothetical protein AAGG38_08655 [Planctomycetota bacterium]